MIGELVLRVTQLNASPVAYLPVLHLQELIAAQLKIKAAADTLLLLQHSPVYTMGKRGSEADFRVDAAEALAAGAAVVAVPRGGETTYHGPGQLVAYPILSLRGLRLGVRAYVEALEDAMVAAVGRYGIAARGRVPGRTGVWVGDRKIGAVGVRVSSGVTTHGLALNVSPDLAAFDRIVPCGQRDRGVTSLQRELGCGAAALDLRQVAAGLVEALAGRLGYARVEWLPEVGELVAAEGGQERGAVA